MLIVLAVNLANFLFGAVVGRIAGLQRGHRGTFEFSSGMRSNGAALVVGIASFLKAPLVTVPAAIYIISQHLLASQVKARLAACLGDGEPRAPAKAAPVPDGCLGGQSARAQRPSRTRAKGSDRPNSRCHSAN